MNGKNWPEEIWDAIECLIRRFSQFSMSLETANEILIYAVRKCEMIGKGTDYLPLLFENELEDHLMRTHINLIGGQNHELLAENPGTVA